MQEDRTQVARRIEEAIEEPQHGPWRIVYAPSDHGVKEFVGYVKRGFVKGEVRLMDPADPRRWVTTHVTLIRSIEVDK